MAKHEEKQLWCMRSVGPDELFAYASKEEAERAAVELRANIREMAMKNPTSFGDLSRLGDEDIALAEPWPHSAKAHAADIAIVYPTIR